MYGVGIIGSGPGVGALHLPTLAALDDRFRVVHIADSGSGRAHALSEQSDARWSTGVDALIADPAVDVVAICSPPERHAEHLLAAIEGGVRAVLCEKPLATTHDDADRVVGAARASGTVIVTGTNHLYDPAWARFKRHLDESQTAVRAITITLAVAPNARYHAAVSETESAPAPQRPRPDLSMPAVAAGIVRSLVLGLGVHDLPLVRDLAPDLEGVDFVRALAPIGFDLGYRSSGVAIRHTAVMLPAGADTHWRIAVTCDHDRIELDFPPPFVSAGGALIRVIDPEGRVTEHPIDADNGYLREWVEVAQLLDGERPVEYGELQADAHFAIDVADAAASAVSSESAA